MKYTFIILLATLSFTTQSALALVSFSTSGSAGFYRDDQQKSHLPFYYSLGYTGLHQGGIESSLEVVLSNDITVTEWQVIPAQLLVKYPLSEGQVDAPFKKSRIQLGRQLFAESFDMAILDGVQAPVYWATHGGIWLYGGSFHNLDLLDTNTTPLVGASLFQDIFGAQFRVGYSGRRDGLAEKVSYGSVLKNFDEIIFKPQILGKTEFDHTTSIFSQSLTELQMSPFDKVHLSVSHSYRNPRRIAASENIFLYRLIAMSPQETEQAAIYWSINDSVELQTSARLMRFNTGQQNDWGHQQEVSLPISFTSHQALTPSVGHMTSYGGELWDLGLMHRIALTDNTELRSEIASAYLNKINNINGWAHHLREGLQFLLASRLTAMAWVEVERNHLFEIDTRVLANVTYFQ